MSKYDRVLLVVRDYRECLLRHNAKQWSEIGSVEAFLDAEGSFQWPGWYIENIRSFHSHEGPKHLLYYEDLIDEPENSIREISEFLGLSERRTDSFLSDLDRRYARSVDAYTSTGHQALTAGRPRGGHQHHAMLHLDARQMAEFDAYYRDREPDLFETYLARYEVAE
ncbi:MAG: sulfotransferase domain-containing protein [Actinomycetota bacterium]